MYDLLQQSYICLPYLVLCYMNKWKIFIPNSYIMFQVDMPVFFYIDPDFLDDPFLENTNEITLSYTFFESKPGMKLPTYNPGELELCI